MQCVCVCVCVWACLLRYLFALSGRVPVGHVIIDEVGYTVGDTVVYSVRVVQADVAKAGDCNDVTLLLRVLLGWRRGVPMLRDKGGNTRTHTTHNNNPFILIFSGCSHPKQDQINRLV